MSCERDLALGALLAEQRDEGPKPTSPCIGVNEAEREHGCDRRAVWVEHQPRHEAPGFVEHERGVVLEVEPGRCEVLVHVVLIRPGHAHLPERAGVQQVGEHAGVLQRRGTNGVPRRQIELHPPMLSQGGVRRGTLRRRWDIRRP